MLHEMEKGEQKMSEKKQDKKSMPWVSVTVSMNTLIEHYDQETKFGEGNLRYGRRENKHEQSKL